MRQTATGIPDGLLAVNEVLLSKVSQRFVFGNARMLFRSVSIVGICDGKKQNYTNDRFRNEAVSEPGMSATSTAGSAKNQACTQECRDRLQARGGTFSDAGDKFEQTKTCNQRPRGSCTATCRRP